MPSWKKLLYKERLPRHAIRDRRAACNPSVYGMLMTWNLPLLQYLWMLSAYNPLCQGEAEVYSLGALHDPCTPAYVALHLSLTDPQNVHGQAI